jgi:hypothetical protein
MTLLWEGHELEEGKMVDDTALDAAELQALRQEITSHFTLSATLIALELAAFGSSLSFVDKSTHVLAGLAVISSFLWLLWIDHSTQILKIAAYIAIELAPRMRQHLGRPVLGWEVFLRCINSGGERSATALHGVSRPPRAKIVRPLRPEWYAPLLFGVAPPLLFALYVSANLRSGTATTVVWLACAAGGALWVFTISRFIDFVHNAKVIDRAILKTESEMGDEQVPTDSAAGPVRSGSTQLGSTRNDRP